MTTDEFIYVTGDLNVTTPERAEQVLQAFREVDKGGGVKTVYVLGSMFGPEPPTKNAMDRFMRALPCRKILVRGTLCTQKEADMKHWHNVSTTKILDLWGKRFLLASSLAVNGFPLEMRANSVLIHTMQDLVDTGSRICASWDHWGDQFGPGGLQNLYALGVLAEQFAAGMACPETREPV